MNYAKITLLVAVCCSFLLPMASFGQRARPINWLVKVEEIRLDRVRNVDPGYRMQGINSDSKSEWIQMYAVFNLAVEGGGAATPAVEDAKWAENVEFSWSVILPREFKGKIHPKYSRRLHSQVTYDAIHEGEKLVAMMFIHPRTYERFKKDLSRDMAMVQLQVKIDGKTRAECWARGRDFASDRRGAARIFPEFGRGPIWFDWEEVPKTTGLVSRMATPWAHSGRFFRILREEAK